MVDSTDSMEVCAYCYVYYIYPFIYIYMPVLPHSDRKVLREAVFEGVFQI
jgi:hypothetical protein